MTLCHFQKVLDFLIEFSVGNTKEGKKRREEKRREEKRREEKSISNRCNYFLSCPLLNI